MEEFNVHDNSFESYHRRRGGDINSAKALMPVLRRAATRRAGDGLLVLDVGGGYGGPTCTALEMLRTEGVNVPVKKLTVVDPCKKFLVRYKACFSKLYPDAEMDNIAECYVAGVVKGKFDVIMTVHSVYYLGIDGFYQLRDDHLAADGEICAVFGKTPVHLAREYIAAQRKGDVPLLTVDPEELIQAKGEKAGFTLTYYDEGLDVTDIRAGATDQDAEACLRFLVHTEEFADAEQELCRNWIKKTAVEVAGSWKILYKVSIVTWCAKDM